MPSSCETTARDHSTGSCSQIKSTGAPPLYAWLQFGDDFYGSRVRTAHLHRLPRPPAWCRACLPPHSPRHALLLAPLPVETWLLMPSSTCPRLAACAAASGDLAAACAAAGGDHALLLSTLPVEVVLPLPVRCCLESRREMERTTHGRKR